MRMSQLQEGRAREIKDHIAGFFTGKHLIVGEFPAF
jgi:hypothetical protein